MLWLWLFRQNNINHKILDFLSFVGGETAESVTSCGSPIVVAMGGSWGGFAYVLSEYSSLSLCVGS